MNGTLHNDHHRPLILPLRDIGFVDLFYDLWIQKSHHFYDFWIQNFFVHFYNFWLQKLLYFCGFWIQKLHPFQQFLYQEFFVHFYWIQKLQYFCSFWIQKLHHFYDFWGKEQRKRIKICVSVSVRQKPKTWFFISVSVWPKLPFYPKFRLKFYEV